MRRQRLPQLNRRAMADRGVYAEGIHELLGAQKSPPHTRLGLVAAVENGWQIGDALATVADADDEELGRVAFDGELRSPAQGVDERIAHDFGDRSRNARPLVDVELEERGNLPRPLAHEDDVRFRADVRSEKQGVHVDFPPCSRVFLSRSRPTRTTTSSRRLAKSR